MSKTIDFIALQAASESYCTSPLPESWDEMDNDEREEWLDDNRWPEFGGSTYEELYGMIETQADNVKYAISQSLDELKEQLVKAALNDALPLDFNEIDLQAMLKLK